MTEVVAQDDTVTFEKNMPPFQLLPMSKELRIHEAPPLQKAKSQVITERLLIVPVKHQRNLNASCFLLGLFRLYCAIIK